MKLWVKRTSIKTEKLFGLSISIILSDSSEILYFPLLIFRENLSNPVWFWLVQVRQVHTQGSYIKQPADKYQKQQSKIWKAHRARRHRSTIFYPSFLPELIYCQILW
jgi:hypothetical protein